MPAIGLAVGSGVLTGAEALPDAALQDGLAGLSALVFPESGTAEWGHSDLLSASNNSRMPYGRAYGEPEPDTDGNAWLLTLSDGSRWLSDRWGTSMISAAADVAWKPADLKKDVGVTLKFLRDRIKNPSKSESLPWNRPDGGTDTRIQALLFAALLHRAGAAVEAPSAARLALDATSPSERESLIRQSLTVFASAEMERVISHFRTQQDWNAFALGLRSLTDRFGDTITGWRGVVVLTAMAEKRASSAADPPPIQWTGGTPGAGDEALIAAWLEDSEAETTYGSWVLPTGNGDRDRSAFPFSVGRAAVPLLAGLLADNTLTSRFPQGQRGGGLSDISVDESEGATASTVRDEFEQIYDRPRTRAELAWELLEQVLPSQWRSSMREVPGEGKAKAILDWWNNVKDLTDLDFALQYLEDGDHSEVVLDFVIQHGNETAWTKVEDILLQDVQPWNLRNVEAYAAVRGEAARPFVDNVIEQLRATDLKRYGDASQMKEQIDRSIRALELALATDASSLGDFLDAMVEGESSPQDLLSSIQRTIQKETPSDVVDAMLERIDQTEDPEVLQYLLRFATVSAMEGEDISKSLTRSEAERLMEKHRERLTAVVRLAGEKSRDPPHGALDAPAVKWGQLHLFASMLVLGLHEDDPNVQMEKLGALSPLGKRLLEVRHRHVLAVLDGDSESRLPSPDTVAKGRVEEILKSLKDADAPDAWAVLDQLDDSEHLALWQALGGFTEEWPSSLLEIARTIRKTEIPNAMQGIVEGMKLEGEIVSETLVHELATRLAAAPPKDEIQQLVITQGALNEGWTLSVQSLKEWPKWGLKDQAGYFLQAAGTALEKAETATVGFVRAGARSPGSRFAWLEAPLSAKTIEAGELPEEDASSVDAAERRALQQAELEAWQALEALDRGKSLPWGGAGSVYLFQFPARWMAPSNDGDDSDPFSK